MGKINGPEIRSERYHSFESPNKVLLELQLNSTSGIRAKFIDSRSPRLEEERHMKKLLSETEESHGSMEAGAAQVYGGRIHNSVESVEMISSFEIVVSIKISKGARMCYYVRKTLDPVRDFTVFLGYIYMTVFFSQHEGCCIRVEVNRLMQGSSMCDYESLQLGGVRLNMWKFKSRLCMFLGFLHGNKWVYRVSQLQSGSERCSRQGVHSGIKSKGFWFETLVIQVPQVLQGSFRESRWRSFVVDKDDVKEGHRKKRSHEDLNGRDGSRLKETKSKVINFSGTEIFQRSKGMQVIFAKDDQRILQLHMLVVVWQQCEKTDVIMFRVSSSQSRGCMRRKVSGW
ncbi:hypothetical protein F2Q69_00016332 [Brassica cretica]|uniref:Uncharacterized protein n=1 Tax=Brassica cretica TaxID=69181 RepID=A0A8S9QR60_BRACR|nr:hypothetical protein F2Q69_00016332 [Brassica cretica]